MLIFIFVSALSEQNVKRGNYLSISSGYGFHGGPNARTNVVHYHLTSEGLRKESLTSSVSFPCYEFEKCQK